MFNFPIHNIILPKYLVIVKKKGSSLIFSASGGWDKEKKEKSAEKIAGSFQQAGKNSFPQTPFLFARLFGLRPKKFCWQRDNYESRKRFRKK